MKCKLVQIWVEATLVCFKILYGCHLKRLMKFVKTLICEASNSAGIRVQYHPNAGLEYFRYNKVLSRAGGTGKEEEEELLSRQGHYAGDKVLPVEVQRPVSPQPHEIRTLPSHLLKMSALVQLKYSSANKRYIHVFS